MWPAVFKAFLALVVALVQLGVVLFSYESGKDDERHRWRDWLASRRIPRHHFFVQGVYQPEPLE